MRHLLCLFAPDAENKESLSKNGITHILSVYNNAKPVFEVSTESTLGVFTLLANLFLDVLNNCTLSNAMLLVGQLEVVMSRD